jgi:hypothetical protein
MLSVVSVLVPASVGASVGADVGASQSADPAIARSGTFVQSDFPAAFTSAPPPATTHAEQIAMAKGIDGCAPYVSGRRRIATAPSADSKQFTADGQTIGNEVAVLPSEKAAASLVALDAKPSMIGCLENLLEKQYRRSGGSQVQDVSVSLQRQDLTRLGDDSVVYEGTVDITVAGGATKKIGVGNALVRVGRALDAVDYSTTGASLTDVLAPAIDESVSRLRSALTRGGS